MFTRGVTPRPLSTLATPLSTLSKQICIVVARRNFPKRNILNKKTQKMLITCRSTGVKSEWPSRCNAFAIARFLVYCVMCALVMLLIKATYLLIYLLRALYAHIQFICQAQPYWDIARYITYACYYVTSDGQNQITTRLNRESMITRFIQVVCDSISIRFIVFSDLIQDTRAIWSKFVTCFMILEFAFSERPCVHFFICNNL